MVGKKRGSRTRKGKKGKKGKGRRKGAKRPRKAQKGEEEKEEEEIGAVEPIQRSRRKQTQRDVVELSDSEDETHKAAMTLRAQQFSALPVSSSSLPRATSEAASELDKLEATLLAAAAGDVGVEEGEEGEEEEEDEVTKRLSARRRDRMLALQREEEEEERRQKALLEEDDVDAALGDDSDGVEGGKGESGGGCTVRVVSRSGEVIWQDRIQVNDPLQVVVDKFAAARSIAVADVKLLLDGEALDPTETLTDFDVEDGGEVVIDNVGKM